jgi:hypothetical protein
MSRNFKLSKIVRSVCLEDGSVEGWQCCRDAQLPSATPKNPPPFIISLSLSDQNTVTVKYKTQHIYSSLSCFSRDGSDQYSIRTAGGQPFFVRAASVQPKHIYNITA